MPLQTWLPDAMAGPTPVSALIHAATMVTAGVYLVARMHDLYLLSPEAQFAVALVGLATLFIASFTALTQRDIKRILAYSTMSQIGYMFLALGVGAWSAAIFHLMTHAFFKALLFLSAGSVILALHHEQDIFRMGGLWKRLPVPFWCMVVGSAALAALPLTSGFYSKDIILLTSFDYAWGGPWFWGLRRGRRLHDVAVYGAHDLHRLLRRDENGTPRPLRRQHVAAAGAAGSPGRGRRLVRAGTGSTMCCLTEAWRARPTPGRWSGSRR